MKIERCAAMPECLEHRELADALGHDEQGHTILHAVARAGITTPEQLAQQDDADLMDVPHLSRARIVLIWERLAEAAGIGWAHPPLHDDDDLAEAEAAGIRWTEETARDIAVLLGASAHPNAKGWAEALHWFAARIHGGQVSLQADKEFAARFGFAASDRREPGLLFPREVAAIFRVAPKTVQRWAAAGRLTAVRTLGGHRRYRQTEVRALLGGLPAEAAEQPAPAQHTGNPAGRRL